MKKVRVELKAGVNRPKTLLLFESPEALYAWLMRIDDEEPYDSFNVDLNPGDYLEAEWMGCECVYDGVDTRHIRLDLVRMAKAMPTKNGSGMLVSIHYGWLSSDQMKFKNSADSISRTTLLMTEADCKLDLPVLFNDEAEPKDVKDLVKPSSAG
jgi:hypothetical protein